MNELVSIIIPVYKVENYLKQCLDSVLNQTYTNLQIILVDDGSPDNCGKICDNYAKQDNRIEVIHKENGGVSSARNAGLRIAKGEYIGWIDSDDWIEPDMYKVLLAKLKESDADVAICGRFEHQRNAVIKKGWDEDEVLSSCEAMNMLLMNDIVQNFLWDKLWKRKLFDNIVFPEGKTYEDISELYKLIEKSNYIFCSCNYFYHYRQRTGSIVDDISLENRINHYYASKKRCDDMMQRWPKYESLLKAQCASSAINIWCCFEKNNRHEKEKYLPIIKRISVNESQNCKYAKEEMNYGIVGKMVLNLIPYPTWWAFKLACFLSWVYKVKHGRSL